MSGSRRGRSQRTDDPAHARTDRGPHRHPPTELLVEGGYPGHDAIGQAIAAGVTLYAPVPKQRGEASEPPTTDRPHLPKPGDSAAVAACMGTDDAK